jgi:Skp family chaperone for outer membrane proteins
VLIEFRRPPGFAQEWARRKREVRTLCKPTRLSKKEFWMRKFGVCLALTGAAVWMTGCGMQLGGQSSSRGGIAVVDLDKVAAESGRKLEMDEAFELQRSSVNQQLTRLQTEAKSILEAKTNEVKELDEKTEAEKRTQAQRELAQMTLNARNNLSQIQNAAGGKLNEYKQVQIAKFRNEIKPILQDVATKRGLAVVIPKNDGLLLAVDPGVDITDDVIKGFREKRPAASAPAPAAAAPAAAAKAPETAAAKPAATAPKSAAREKAREPR